jgi:hypothetical protein
MSAKKKENHVVVDGSAAGGGSLVCLNCGERHTIAYPVEMRMLSETLKAFSRIHKPCKPRPNPERERNDTWSDTTQCTPQEWIDGVDTGVSSATIWSTLSGRPTPFRDHGIPHDPSDFGRCYRLLKRIDGWRERLPEVAARHPEWAPFVAAWDELTALYEQEIPNHRGHAPLLYARLQGLR